MEENIQRLMNQIRALEDELKEAIRQREFPLLYKIEGTRIKFAQLVKQY